MHSQYWREEMYNSYDTNFDAPGALLLRPKDLEIQSKHIDVDKRVDFH
jgi:hypothetical protein